MPKHLPFDRRLLGGLSPDEFLSRHWQRRPLLIRAAIADMPKLPDRAALAAMAARDDVESRLIAVAGGRWTMTAGPIERLPRKKRGWTLLVQGVNLLDAGADALMRRFDFVSAMRLDDLMISHAVDGGGVGPHLDSYDVFLLQVTGRRCWRWRERASTSEAERALVDDAPLRLLRNFVPTHEATLDPGDMLYLPPSCAHEGVAVGDCTTASIGFRAPSWDELSREFLFSMAETAWPDGRHRDAGRAATASPGRIDDGMLAAIEERFARIRWTASDVERFVGKHFSEPKPHVWFEPPRPMPEARFAKRAARLGIALDPRTTLLYRGTRGYIAGEMFMLPPTGRAQLRQLADRRRLDAAGTGALIGDPQAATLLHDWWTDGWIHFEGETNGPS